MKTKDFFTQEFYDNPELTLNVLNELVQQKQVADKEMYNIGTFLFMAVYDNEETRSILSPIISDLDAYKSCNNENFVSDNTDNIGLCALEHEHSSVFRFMDGDKEIKWDNEEQKFVFAEDMPSKFEEE